MSKYTTELRFICENSAGLTESVGYSGIDEVLDKARDKVFDFDFPIFDENYRNVLENKILKHYYTREIGAESVGLWKFWLNTRLNEIMPYYNQLYQSELIKFNPMYDVDLTTDYQKVDNGTNNRTGSFSEQGNHTENTDRVDNFGETKHETRNETNDGTNNTNTNNTSANKNDHWDYYSDTPQGGINGLANNTYLTNARHITDDGTGSTSSSQNNSTTSNDIEVTADTSRGGSNTSEIDTTGTNSKSGNSTDNAIIKNTEDYLHHVVGKTGGISYSKLLKEFRSTFLNIDMQIINELSDLFMNIW